ncbi:MAG: glycosyltransferase family 2 protein [Candidatus Aminicenantes bacterium]|nr:glycosyltransferase family 2 protein [Candidatus Aminicenantes bacterium]
MIRLSVVIAARNEERNIRRCLESVKWADEIIVIDDMSTDRTFEIARLFTENVFSRESQGDFHRNKNFGLSKASGEWILSLDADEVIPPELAQEINQTIESSLLLGYDINRKNFFLGKWIKGCGWWPDYILRLFRKGVTCWPLAIHDVPQIEDKKRVGFLKNSFLHYSYVSFNQYFEKFNLYTTQVAKEEYAKGVRLSLKNFFILFFLKPLFWFVKKYIFLGGFQDGFRGFFICFSSALTIFVAYSKLWEIEQAKK